MRIFFEKPVTQPHLSDVRCNSCGRDVEKEDPGYFEDHVSLTKTWGYHSPFDGENHDIALCVDCYQDWVQEFEIPPLISPHDGRR